MKRVFARIPIAVLVLVSTFGCEGKGASAGGRPASIAKTPPTEPAEPAEPAEQVLPAEAPIPSEANPRRFTGAVAVDIGGTSKRFEVLSPEETRLVHAGQMKLVHLDAYPKPEATEHLMVRLQGFELDQMIDKPLRSGRGKHPGMARHAAVLYTDAQGIRYGNYTGIAQPLQIRLTAYTRGESIEGTFSGTLREREGTRTVKIENGTFSMKRAPSD